MRVINKLKKRLHLLLYLLLFVFLISANWKQKETIGQNKQLAIDTSFNKVLSEMRKIILPSSFSYKYDDVDEKLILSDDFIRKYICEYDNFCGYGEEIVYYKPFKGLFINDSIFIFMYHEYNLLINRKVMIVFNTYKKIEVDRLMIAGYKTGRYQMESYIDSNLLITTKYYYSLRGIEKRPSWLKQGYDRVRFRLNKYRLKPDGHLEHIFNVEGRYAALHNEYGNFSSISSSDTLNIINAFKYHDNNEEKIAGYLDKGIINDNELFLINK